MMRINYCLRAFLYFFCKLLNSIYNVLLSTILTAIGVNVNVAIERTNIHVLFT